MKGVQSLDGRVARTTTWIAGVVAVTVALLLPAGYLTLSYQNAAASPSTEAEVVAAALSQYVNSHPETWDLEAHRLESFLATHRYNAEHEAREWQRVVDVRGGEIVVSGARALRWPVLMPAAPIRDAGVPVGRLRPRTPAPSCAT